MEEITPDIKGPFSEIMEAALYEFVQGESVLVNAQSLPFFVKRHIVLEKRRRGEGISPIYWIVGEQVSSAEEERVDAFFATTYPNAYTIVFAPNAKVFDEYQCLIDNQKLKYRHM